MILQTSAPSAISFSDSKFRCEAFGDYCDSLTENYSCILKMVADVIELFADDEVPSSINTEISDIIDKYGFTKSSQILFNKGYITCNDLLLGIASVETQSITSPEFDENTYFFKLTSASKVITDVGYYDVLDELKANMHAIASLAASAHAMKFDSITDRIISFNDGLSQRFSEAYSDLSGLCTALRNVIHSATSTSAYFQSINEFLGASKLAEDDSPSLPEQFPSYQYAGVNPLTGAASGAVRGLDIVGSAINVGAKIVSSVINGAVSLVSSAFSWIGSKVSGLSNPVDFEVLDGKGNTFDGFFLPTYRYNETSSIYHDSIYDIPVTADTVDGVYGALNLAAQSMNGSSYTYRLSMADIMVSFRSATASTVSSNRMARMTFTSANYARLKPITASYYDFCRTKINDYIAYVNDPSHVVSSASEMEPYLDGVQDYPNKYVSASSQTSEVEVLRGLIMSNVLMRVVCKLISLEVATIDPDSSSSTRQSYSAYFQNEYSRSSASFLLPELSAFGTGSLSVTNKSLLTAVSGWNGVTFGSNEDLVGTLWGGSNIALASGYAPTSVDEICISAEFLKRYFPVSYPFIPYKKNDGFENDPTYRIKTDNENVAAVEKIFTIGVTVVIAIVAAAAIGIACKALSSALFRKAVRNKTIIENKIISGESLSLPEKLKYTRARRRVYRANYLLAGLQSTTSASVMTTLGDLSSAPFNGSSDKIYF